jgi:integration host factor subunit beta
MTRSELTKRLAEANPSLARSDLERLVAVLFDAIGDQLIAGGRVEIRRFGLFWLKTRDARTGRNPRTGEEVAVAAKRVPTFRPSSSLIARLNRRA